MSLRPDVSMGNDTGMNQRIDNIIKGNTFRRPQDSYRIDFSAKIANREDCEFTESVVKAIFDAEDVDDDDLEYANYHLKVNMSARLGTTILVWAEGLMEKIDLDHWGKVMQLQHPVPGFNGVKKIYIVPPKSGRPERLMVEINSCVGK